MGKKKLLKENENLKLKLENLRNSKIELENKIFNEKIKSVTDTLESLGNLEWTIDYERSFFDCPEIVTRRNFTFILNV
jgi:predicted RNA-binding protein with EMAP domain